MIKIRNDTTSQKTDEHYTICVQGQIDPHWKSWFGGLTMTHKENRTFLNGPVPDQAALHGILKKIRDLGLSLVSVERQS